MSKLSLRTGLPYRWWTTDTFTALWAAPLIIGVWVFLVGAWVGWWA